MYSSSYSQPRHYVQASGQLTSTAALAPDKKFATQRIRGMVYSRRDSTKSPASGIDPVSEPRLVSQFGRMREVVCA